MRLLRYLLAPFELIGALTLGAAAMAGVILAGLLFVIVMIRLATNTY